MTPLRRILSVLALAGWMASASGADDPGAPAQFSFGVLADVQAGDKDPTARRNFRGAYTRLNDAIACLNTQALICVVQLGDAIDGYPNHPKRSRRDYDKAKNLFAASRHPLYAVVGNHDLTAGPAYLAALHGSNVYYGVRTPASCPGWVFILLDGNDAGAGNMSTNQIHWLDARLTQADAAGQRAILCCHYPVAPGAALVRLNNAGDVLAVLDRHPSVAAWLAGHDHVGGYVDRRGVQHVTFKGMVESPTSAAFAVVAVFSNRLELAGYGREPSRALPLP